MIEHINPETIDNLEDARLTIRALLKMLESVLSTSQGQQEEIQKLKDEVNRAQRAPEGEQGKPTILASKKPVDKDHSSE